MTPRRILHLEVAKGFGGSTSGLSRLVKGSRGFGHIVLFEDKTAYECWEQIEGVSALLLNGKDTTNGSASGGPKDLMNSQAQKWLNITHYMYLLQIKVMADCLFWVSHIHRLIKREDVSLVHLSNGLLPSPVNWGAVWAAWRAGIPCVVRLQSFRPVTSLQLLLASKVNMFMPISDAIKRSFLEQGIPSSKMRVIYSGIPVEQTVEEKNDKLKSELGIKDNEKVVGIVARLAHWKGVHIFLEAASEVSKAVPNVKFLVVGGKTADEPLYADSLIERANRSDLQNKCILLGFHKDVQKYIAIMDVFVHASILPEPFGIVILEGSISGKPVVATNAGGVPEIIKEGDTGLLVPPGDAHEMARAIVYLLENPDVANRMGRKGREHVLNNFSVSRMVAEMEHLFEEILDQKKVRPQVESGTSV